MVRTRNMQANAAQRRQAIIERITGYEVESTIDLALTHAGIINMMDIVTVPYEHFEDMDYEYNLDWDNPDFDPAADPNHVPIFEVRTLRRFEGNLLKCVKAFAQHHIQNGTILSEQWWDAVQRQTFDEYRITADCTARISTGGGGAQLAMTNQRSQATDPHEMSLKNWDKGLKRDPTVFTELKSDTGWPSWNRSFVANVFAQQVEEVLDSNYTPTEAEKPLFRRKQDYLYSVLNRILKTDQGKSAVRAHEDNRDAQAVYRSVKKHCEKSTKASIQRSDILTYLTQARLGDGSWKGTTYGFILHWTGQVEAYEKDAETPEEKFSPSLKMTMLQNSVRAIDDLRKVQGTARHLKAAEGTETKWEQYVELLSSAAQEYDAARGNGNNKWAKRQVYTHESLYFSPI